MCMYAKSNMTLIRGLQQQESNKHVCSLKLANVSVVSLHTLLLDGQTTCLTNDGIIYYDRKWVWEQERNDQESPK